jgi:hypothetical protein
MSGRDSCRLTYIVAVWSRGPTPDSHKHAGRSVNIPTMPEACPNAGVPERHSRPCCDLVLLRHPLHQSVELASATFVSAKCKNAGPRRSGHLADIVWREVLRPVRRLLRPARTPHRRRRPLPEGRNGPPPQERVANRRRSPDKSPPLPATGREYCAAAPGRIPRVRRTRFHGRIPPTPSAIRDNRWRDRRDMTRQNSIRRMRFSSRRLVHALAFRLSSQEEPRNPAPHAINTRRFDAFLRRRV